MNHSWQRINTFIQQLEQVLQGELKAIVKEEVFHLAALQQKKEDILTRYRAVYQEGQNIWSDPQKQIFIQKNRHLLHLALRNQEILQKKYDLKAACRAQLVQSLKRRSFAYESTGNCITFSSSFALNRSF